MISVIIAAAGQGLRMGGIDKQFSTLGDMPIIAHSMLKFESIEEVSEIVIAVSPRNSEVAIDEIKSIAQRYNITKLAAVARGGDTRQQSVFKAFAACDKQTRYIAVHDGARPLVNADIIRQCIKDASIFGGATLGVAVKETLKIVEDNFIIDTPDRRKLYQIQTPQIFRRDIYVKGINFANDHNLDFTDDCQLAEAVGLKVYVTESDYKNIKITTPEDLGVAECIFLAI